MKAVIYIEVLKEVSFSYENPHLVSLKKEYPDATILDLDNFSTEDVIKNTLRLIEEASIIEVIIRCKDTTCDLGKTPQIFRKLMNKRKVVSLHYEDQHPSLDRLCRPFSG